MEQTSPPLPPPASSGAPARRRPPEVFGVVAGRGAFPLLVCRAARQAGVKRVVALAMHRETAVEIEDAADHTEWFFVGQLQRGIDYLKRQGVRHCVLAGQVRPRRLFTGIRPDLRAFRMLRKLQVRNAQTLFSALITEFAKDGIEVLPSTTFMEDALAGAGVLGRVRPGRRVRRDIAFGLEVAREVSRLEIGQTVVVKKGVILAVEGFEGTDQAIRRGGRLGHGGVTVVKLAKPGHDMRFDVPCIGLRTVESLRLARAAALAVRAGATLFLDKSAVLAACDRAGIAVVGIAAGE